MNTAMTCNERTYAQRSMLRRIQHWTRKGKVRSHHNATRSHTAANYPLEITTVRERFLNRIAQALCCGPDGRLERPHRLRSAEPCIIWPGPPEIVGYGRIRVVVAPDIKIYTHVLAARMFILDGGEIPDGMQVNHTCDVKMCCNYRHLYLGCHDHNMADLRTRGSFAHQLEQERRMYGSR